MSILLEPMLVEFEVYYDEYWCGRGIGEDIYTQGKSLDELITNIKEAVGVHFTELLEERMHIKIFFLFELYRTT